MCKKNLKMLYFQNIHIKCKKREVIWTWNSILSQDMLSKTALEIYDLLNAFCFSFCVELTNTSRVEPFLIWFYNAKYIFSNKYPPKLGLKNYLLKIKWKVSSDGWQLDTQCRIFFFTLFQNCWLCWIWKLILLIQKI